MGTVVSRALNSSPKLHSHRKMARVMDKSLAAALTKASLASYRRHWSRFSAFVRDLYTKQRWPDHPVNREIMAALITYLFSCHYAPATIISNVSAISYIHKMKGWVDPCEYFLNKKLLLGAQNWKGTIDMRLPINIDNLCKIWKHAKSVTSS